MNNFWRRMKQALTGEPEGDKPSATIVRSRQVVLAPEQRLRPVRRERYEARLRPIPYWREMGWTLSDGVFEGAYQAGRSLFPGRIRRLHRTRWEFEVEIARPWPGIDRHLKWPCFRATGRRGWYRLHWNIEPRSVDSGIHDIEKTLSEMLACRPLRAT